MAWGGGNFVTMNKVLAGVYANVTTAGGIGTTVSDRGNVAIGLEGLKWGDDGKIIKLTASEFYQNAETVFGVNAMDESLKGIRDLFKYATTGYFYKLGTYTKANATVGTTPLATARCGGSIGNKLKVSVSANADTDNYNVELLMDNKVVATAIDVKTAMELEDNDWVTWGSFAFSEVKDYNLTGGTDGTADATSYSAFMTAIEPYEELNAIGCVSTISEVVASFKSFIKRLVAQKGRIVQGVVFSSGSDSESIVDVKNSKDLVYWVTGAIGGCAVNKSMTGKKYDGEFTIPATYTEAELTSYINGGLFTLHKVGDDLVVLKDINSLTTYTTTKNKDMASNQVIRSTNAFLQAVKQSFITVDLGNTANDDSGRASVKSRIIDAGMQLLDIGAFASFSGDDVSVTGVVGDRGAIAVSAIITPAQAMDKMYLNVVIN